ncbi:hypothetical protein [Nocardia australiensis]|uniref:hypothetical protein n=1 Tax=Nocardia australiensis TaxID=2887191 RepID=UPI001D1539C5|nr:hypothetical protein [Nocardia australiensis]
MGAGGGFGHGVLFVWQPQGMPNFEPDARGFDDRVDVAMLGGDPRVAMVPL